MSGTTTGGKRAYETNKTRYGDDFMIKIGAKGGKISNPLRPKGFAHNHELAVRAGALGGKVSRRGKARTTTGVRVSKDDYMGWDLLTGLSVPVNTELAPKLNWFKRLLRRK